MDPVISNRHDRPDTDEQLMQQSARPFVNKSGYHEGRSKPYGDEMDGLRTPPSKISLDDSRDKVGSEIFQEIFCLLYLICIINNH